MCWLEGKVFLKTLLLYRNTISSKHIRRFVENHLTTLINLCIFAMFPTKRIHFSVKMRGTGQRSFPPQSLKEISANL